MANPPLSKLFQQRMDLLREVSSFFSLEELHQNRLVSVAFRHACDSDRRWLPEIAPPQLAHQVLDLSNKDHSRVLRKCYFLYLKWIESWVDFYEDGEESLLLQRQSHLDGFFSLAPWSGGVASYPTPWLHRMVYERVCPTELSSAELGYVDELNPQSHSFFFQRRVRSELGSFRIFTSTPIEPDSICREKIRRLVIQPVNFRNPDGTKHPKLPDCKKETLNGVKDTAKRVFQCYFGENGVDLNPVHEHKGILTLDRSGMYCRNDVQGLRDANGARVVQVNAHSLVGVCGTNAMGNPAPNAAIVLLIAPHMYHKKRCTEKDELAWCFSTYLGNYPHIYPDTCPWATSTFQFERFNDNLQSMICQLTCSMMYSMLQQLSMGGICENTDCAMNNCDSVGEAEESARLILCALCLRKLHLGGVIQDIPAFLNNLSGVLQQEPFATYCCRDSNVLRKWGFEGPSKKPRAA